MSHWYHKDEQGNVTLFNENHKLWGRLKGWPTIKSGALAKKINDNVRLELGLYPSVTTILKYVGESEGLLGWAGNLGIEAGMKAAAEGWTLDGAKGYLKQKKEEASTRGTEFHKAIEVFLTSGVLPEDPAMATACAGVANMDLTGKKEWCGAWEYAGARFAGTVDHLHDNGVDDFKTMKKVRKPSLSDVSQVAAYIAGAFDTTKFDQKARNIYILQDTGRIYSVVEWTRDQLLVGWEYFSLAYQVWTWNMKWSASSKGE